ncbi:hypothetical protein [Ralstonia pseudosolanacearum]|uniref:hypothetical protein n=1 Tax=Ralstonia pseudosolanacearum TaxID=1310165 RepID=UPI00201DFEF0|nr:hypothetical protein [Ralstonia pseudosolanacearum]UQY83672.1 hypothetical protein JNO62_06010 [Ralstonia pseudosolanacearum]
MDTTAAPQAQPSAAPAGEQQAHNPDAQTHATMAAALVERGIWTQQQADAALRGDDPAAAKPADQQGTPQPGVAKAPEGVDEMSARAFAGEASPAAYRFEPAPQGAAVSLEQETAMRQMFHQHEVPQAMVSEISRLWNKALANPPDEAAGQRAYQESMAQLARTYGAERDNVLKVARSEVQRIAKTHPQIRDMLEVSGLGNNAWIASSLYQMARAKGRA